MRMVRFARLAPAAAILYCSVTLGYAQPAAPAGNPELAAMGVWDDATTYATDDIVSARGSAWISLKDGNTNKIPGRTGALNTAAWWQLFARGFNPTGAWSNATTYQPDDLVTHDGQTYRAKLTHSNRLPTNPNFWELLAAKGADGEQGLQGPQGAQGPQGPAGPNTGISAGSASVPALSFNEDADTGIYSPQAGKIAMVEDGALFLHNLGTSNTAFGLSALAVNTGSHNTAVGQSALAANTTGSFNAALGRSALGFNSTGSFNAALGWAALGVNQTGGSNIAIGYSALAANTTGSNNIAVGQSALANNTTSDNNTAVGALALIANTGTANTAVGYSALAANTSGGTNTALGYLALAANTSNANTAVGYSALAANTSGSTNAALGREALATNTTGGSNTALGYFALRLSTTGNQNTAVGKQALDSNTTGGGNVAIGYLTLSDNQTGSSNIAIGNSAGSGETDLQSSISIGSNGVAGESYAIKIGSPGTQSKAYIAGISGVTISNGTGVFVNGNGQLGTATSSRRYKDDIESIGDVTGLLAKLRPVTFRYKQAEKDGSKPKQYGLIAEEVEEASADLAYYSKDGSIETVKYHFLPPLLLAGWQAQQKTIAAQAEELRRQQDINAALEARLARLEAAMSQTKAAALRQ